MNIIDWERDHKSVKIHPTQKPIKVLENLIKIFTDEGDVVIDPVAGSASTLVAANNLNRKTYGFEIKKDFFKLGNEYFESNKLKNKEIALYGYAKTQISKIMPSLFD